ncbi:16S rRNA (guanine(527)-N(7))-methyltransferase RsmG [Arcanobacterium canis]
MSDHQNNNIPVKQDGSVEPAPLHGAEHFGDLQWGRLSRFAQLLGNEGQLRGLVGPREMNKLWSRHLLNSTAINQFIEDSMSVADVGSGAGFPGLVLAITCPGVHVSLIEAMERRSEWLQYVVKDLELDNVEVIRGRAEDLKGFSADVVTARAVAALKKLVPWTMPLVRDGGRVVALKGGRAEVEIDEADKQLRKYGAEWVDVHDVDVWGTSEGTRIVEIKKIKRWKHR